VALMKRKELERLCRYITRPEIANERLKRNQADQVVLQLKSRPLWHHHIVMSPLASHTHSLAGATELHP
jgi:hypothetical protein